MDDETKAAPAAHPRGRFAHFRILTLLGAGGMGEVYRARDEQLGRDVAVKVLPTSSFRDAAARARLVREARAAAALNHPNVCTVHEIGEANGQTFIAMELVEGRTLSSILASGPLPPRQVAEYGRQLADALTHAHDRGVIHRDLKSNNVIVTPDGRVKVLDFGLAKRTADAEPSETATQVHVSVTEPGAVVGTLPYMAPEQLRGEPASVATDVWALGVVLYEMSTVGQPFVGQTAFELSAAILNAPPTPLPPAVPAPLAAVIEKCLAKNPEQRYASAAEVRATLDDARIATAEPRRIAALRAGVTDRIGPSARHGLLRPSRRRAATAAVVAAAIAVAAAGTWSLWPAGAVRTLAVLPFENPARDDDLQYLCEGIADSLIKRTSTLRSLRVSSLATVLHFRSRSANLAAAGRQLGVQAVLTGTLEQDGARLKIAARLIDVASGRPLWTKQFERGAERLLDVQDEIASAIMDEGLRVRLTTDERRRLVRHPTTDGAAYDLYLQARYLQRRATEDDYLQSRQLLEKAVIRDPNFALAYAWLAGNYAMMVTDGLERPTTAWPQVRRYMGQALAIDAELPEAHAFEHALAFLFDWDWAGAERARRRLLQFPLGDFDPHVLRALAMEHWALGRLDEALKLARQTRELDPLSPYLATLEADYLLRSGRHDAAVALYNHSIRVDPGNPNAYFGLAEARFRQRHFEQALEARRKGHEVAGDDSLRDLFATARGEEGYRQINRAWVRVQLDALKERAATSYVSPLDFARAYAQLGEKELAFKYLDAAFADRSPGLVFLNVDPAWDAVRHDSRFRSATGKVGLPGGA